MSFAMLHRNHQRILEALSSAARILGMKEHLTIVGGMGRYLAGLVQHVGDIDVSIKTPLCERYWEFLEILSLHGVVSVFDVLERPQFPWNPCRQRIAHAKALTIDCSANVLMGVGMKHANLDIVFTAADCDAIPHSSCWVRDLDPKELFSLDDATRAKRLACEHDIFMNEVRSAEKDLTNRKLDDKSGLYIAW